MATKINTQPSSMVAIVAVAIGYAMRNKPRRAVRTPMNMLQAECLLMSLAKVSVGINSSLPAQAARKNGLPALCSGYL
jgi:hypothetical protein